MYPICIYDGIFILTCRAWTESGHSEYWQVGKLLAPATVNDFMRAISADNIIMLSGRPTNDVHWA